MTVTNIGPAALLQVQKAYDTNAAQSNSNVHSETSVENAAAFQKMVSKNFDNFSNMKPDQILAVMKHARAATGLQNISNDKITETVGSVSSSIRKSEDVTRRSVMGDATLSEMIAATSEAKATLQATVAVRNQLLAMWREISNMQI